jgi:hypothetical protein
VRVGRAPLDEEAIRLIEEYHPHIRFDWPQILKGEDEVSGPVPVARPSREESPAARPAPEPEPPPVREERQDPVSPAHSRLGSEGLGRLRARYADVLAAISRRVSDEQRRDDLKTQAERLNPDSWVTDDEVQAGLEQYEAVLASLRDVIGRRRRRKRPRRSSAPIQDAGSPAPAPENDGMGPEGEPDL